MRHAAVPRPAAAFLAPQPGPVAGPAAAALPPAAVRDPGRVRFGAGMRRS